MFVGVAIIAKSPTEVEIGICTHDGTYSTDYCIHQLNVDEHISPQDRANVVTKHVIEQLKFFSTEHCLKFVGAGVTEKSLEITPALPSVLWRDMDIVSMVYKCSYTAPKTGFSMDPELQGEQDSFDAAALANGGMYRPLSDEDTVLIDVDEQADSAVRKCTRDFGPGGNPSLTIGFRNQVIPDTGGKVRLVSSLDEYKRTLQSEGTWNSAIKYAKDLRARKIKIAFFSSTPQGGGVALMRHALLRFFKMAGVQASW